MNPTSFRIAALSHAPEHLRRHIVTANFVYPLPFCNAQPGFVGHTLGSWEFSGIAAINSGLPLAVTVGNGSIPPDSVFDGQ